MRHPRSIPTPDAELHIWWARLGSAAWPAATRLPIAERRQAARLLDPRSRRRWVAARWALRGVLAGYLGRDPAAVELRFGMRGKPLLAAPGAPLRFNLSHSADLALIAVCADREVGVDVQRIDSRRPSSFYAEWTRREAVAKCHGVGLGAPLPDDPVATSALDPEPGFAAALAVAGTAIPSIRRLEAEPER